jgi:hypothetical protein
MPKAHKFDGQPWWDDGEHPLHSEDGRRYEHRIDYERLPIHTELIYGFDLYGVWSGNPNERLKARRRLWRRLRTGFYDRNNPKGPDAPRRDNEGVPRCGAKCRDGHACRSRAVKNPVTGKRVRCRMHGGRSPGPRTAEGKVRSLAALARGRMARARNCCLKRQD